MRKVEKTEILPGIEIVSLALWLKKQKILVISDLHIGYEEYLNEQGLMIPRQELKIIKKTLRGILRIVKPKRIIINGDLKHEFGIITKQEWFDSLEILKMLRKKSNLILIKGNHDTIVKPLLKRINFKIKDYFVIDDIAILHGHKIFNQIADKKIKTIIIGHEHPAVSLRELRTEKYKCFLLGKWHKKNLIVMPSFLPLIEGTDVTKEKTLSPFLNHLENFGVFVVADKIYNFGKLKKLM